MCHWRNITRLIILNNFTNKWEILTRSFQLVPFYQKGHFCRQWNHSVSLFKRFSLSACVVHSDLPEIKAMKIRQCSGANRIKHFERQKSGNGAQIRRGIHWVQIIPPMDLTQFSLLNQHYLAEDTGRGIFLWRPRFYKWDCQCKFNYFLSFIKTLSKSEQLYSHLYKTSQNCTKALPSVHQWWIHHLVLGFF